MGHLERGEKNVSFRSIVRVASALNVSLAQLFSGLEAGESEAEGPRHGRGRVKLSGPSVGTGSGRILKELAILERTVRTLKAIALTRDERSLKPAHPSAKPNKVKKQPKRV
jgi:hypothetical protein